MTPAPGFVNGEFYYAGTFLAGGGSAALPSMRFPDGSGFYQAAAGEIDVAVAGTKTLQFYPAGQIFGAQGNNYLQMNAAGAIAFVASGVNQNVTANPSGTGGFIISNTAANIPRLRLVTNDGTAANGLIRWVNNGPSDQAGIGSNFNVGDNGLEFLSGTTTNMRMTSGGNFLVGTTTDNTGKIQLPDHSTTAGGISVGTDIWLSRSGTATAKISAAATITFAVRTNTGGREIQFAVSDAGNSASILDSGFSGSGSFTIGTGVAGRSLLLSSGNNVTFLSGDSAQNAVLKGVIVHSNGGTTVAGLPAAATYQGATGYVTDATQTAITGLGLTVVGGGANKVMVYSDGTNWKIL